MIVQQLLKKLIATLFGEKIVYLVPVWLFFLLGVTLYVGRSFIVFRATRIGIHEVISILNKILFVVFVLAALFGPWRFIVADIAVEAIEVLFILTPLFLLGNALFMKIASDYLSLVFKGYNIVRLLLTIAMIVIIFENLPIIAKQTLGLAIGSLLTIFAIIDVVLYESLVMFEWNFGNEEPLRRLWAVWLISLIFFIIVVFLVLAYL